MKSEKGVTLLSITIYLILLIIVLGVFAIVRTQFHSNVSMVMADGLYASEFNKLNGFLVQDAKRNYHVKVESNRKEGENPHQGTSEQTPVVAFRFGNGNIYLYYGNTKKGTVFGTNSEGKSFGYLNQGVYKYTNQGRALKIAGGVTDMKVEVDNSRRNKTILKVGVEIANGKIFTNMENPMRYTLKYW